MSRGPVAALILAAGRGTRFGRGATASKATASFAGKPMVCHVASAALASRACAVVVVTGHAAASVSAALDGCPVAIIHNPDFAAGLAGSLKAGLAALGPEIGGVLVLLADMPRIGPHTLDTLIAAFETAPTDIDAIIPSCGGRSGNPLLLARRLFARLMTLDGDRGARAVLAAEGRATMVVDVADDGILADVDTPEDLRALDDPR